MPPSEILDRLHQVDPRLGLQFCCESYWSEAHQRLVDCWAITERWPPADMRRRMVYDGSLSADACWDVLCYLPLDCSVDEAFGYFMRSCQRNKGKDSINKMLERIHTFNAKRKEEVLAPTMELAEELITTSKHRIRSDAVSKHKRESRAQQVKRMIEYLDQ